MLRSFRSVSLCLLSLASVQALGSAQTVHTVDDDGGADFVEIQDAVVAAGEGDVILVRAGRYNKVTVWGKSLTIQAEAGEVVELMSNLGVLVGDPALEVRNLGPAQEVFVRGVRVSASYWHPPSGGFPGETILIQDCDGAVWLEGVSTIPLGFGVFDGIVVSNSAGVTLTRCTVDQNATYVSNVGFHGHGLQSTNSNVALFACTLHGGVGSDGRDGGTAAVVDGGTFYASGSTLLGGDGGDGGGFFPTVEDGGDGGNGLSVQGGALVRMQDTVMLAGAAGTALPGGVDGAAGAASQVTSGALVPVIGQGRTLVEASPVRAGTDDFVETFTGQPGDLVYRLYATDGQIAPLYIAFEKAPLVLDFNLFGDVMGPADPSGMLVNSAPSAPMPAGVDGAVITTQASFLAADGTGFYFSAPSVIALVVGNP